MLRIINCARHNINTGIPEKNGAPEITKNAEKMSMLTTKVSIDVRLEDTTITHLGKFIFDMSDALYCMEAMPLLVDSAK